MFDKPFVRHITAMLVLLAGITIVYWQAPENGFHFDDGDDIINNEQFHLQEMSLSALWEAGSVEHLSRRVFANMTLAFDWWRGGGDPEPFQWTNLLIHLMASWATYGLLLILVRTFDPENRWAWVAALTGAAFWALHPVQVQAVTYIVQRMASMAALFSVLAVLCYIWGRQAGSVSRRWLAYSGVVVATLLGATSKENAWIIPGLILLSEYAIVRHGQTLIRNRIDYFVLSLPLALILYVAWDLISGVGPLGPILAAEYQHYDFTMRERLLTQPRVIFFYFSLILWPATGRLSLEQAITTSTGWTEPTETLFALIGLGLFTAMAIWLFFQRHQRLWGFCLLWIPANFAIESSFYALDMIFDHRIYLPLVGVAGLISLGLCVLSRRGVGKLRIGFAVMACLILLLGWRTKQQVALWGDDIKLMQVAVHAAPESAQAWTNLGNAYRNRDRWEEAEEALRKALQLNPEQETALWLLAVRAMNTGRLDEADRLIQRRLNLPGVDHRIINTVGELRVLQGDYSDAINFFHLAQQHRPNEPAYRWNMALALEKAGNCAGAAREWRVFLQISGNQQRQASVRAHLAEVHQRPGGACYRR